MAFARVETDMMNILKYTFKYFMLDHDEILKDEQDITTDEFWDVWFPANILRKITSQGWMGVGNIDHVPLLLISSQYLRLSPEREIIRVMFHYNYSYDRYISMEDNIGNFLFYMYNHLYKEQLREWVDFEYVFCPK